MATVAGAVRRECESLGERATEVWRRASQTVQEVEALRSAAKDALDEGKDAVARGAASLGRKARDLKHVPQDVAYHVRQAPLRATGLAVALGLVAGCLFGCLVTRRNRPA